jgi:K+-sensing histidine kinase KdpD
VSIKKLFQFGRKRQGNVIQVKKLKRQKQQTVGEVAAGNLSAASKDVARMMEAANMATKILVVQDGEHSQVLVDYAVKMAQKLDCEIIALDVSEEPLDYSGERRQREINRFHQRAKRNAETIMLKAEAMAVACRHVAQVGTQEDTIKGLSREDKDIRYVLIKPAEEYVSANKKGARVPVVDLNCSSL